MNRQTRSAYIRETQHAAKRLGLPSYGPTADASIVEYCHRQVSDWVAEHSLPTTMGELLDLVAVSLDVEFVELASDEDLTNLLDRIPLSVEPALAAIIPEFDAETDAVTIRRQNPQPWERRYLAVINCQDWHYHRRYFTKWHELAHRLVDGEQLKFACRPSSATQKDPGEVLVDKISGLLAFYPDIVAPVAKKHLNDSGLSFQAADALRYSVADEASRQAAALALLPYVGRPAWYLRCGMQFKSSEARCRPTIRELRGYVPRLRVIEASPNESAVKSAIRIHRRMRVPETGLISRSLQTGVELSGTELLDNWETSVDGPIGSGFISVDTWIVNDEIFALISLTDGLEGSA